MSTSRYIYYSKLASSKLPLLCLIQIAREETETHLLSLLPFQGIRAGFAKRRIVSWGQSMVTPQIRDTVESPEYCLWVETIFGVG
jgi:hypothetical protein